MENNIKDYYSIAEVANLIGVSRISIFKKIKSGEIPAERIGRSYVVPKKSVMEVIGKVIGEDRKKMLDLGVNKTITDYSSALRKLGKE